MNEYVEDFIPPPPLTDEEESALWASYTTTGDEDARARLIENYLPLVFDMAERMSKKFPTYLDVQDLISYGNFGLLDAIRKFNPAEGVKFSTYCNRRINGAIFDELRKLDWPSRQLRQKVNQVKRAREQLELKLGRPAHDEEMAEYLGLDEKEYYELQRDVQIKNMVPLDRNWNDSDHGDGNQVGAIQMLPDPSAPDPLTELTRQEIKEVAMKGLSDDEKKVLILYYYENLNLKEIGEVLDLSESRVCQIHQKTLAFLKQKFIQREISPYSL
ncbi:MAG: FliA/WhiG family RNA polymerase sigma factor [Planctomycetaceae bacterium]|nr:FliA/WhiG family RNA polymerase sigma factor [Planctomycetaceae bacterium]